MTGVCSIIIVWSLACIKLISMVCLFPDMMQTSYNKTTPLYRDWWTTMRSQQADTVLRVIVAGNSLRATSRDNNTISFTHLCIQQIAAGKYLTAYEAPGQTSGRYTCVQFVFRSSSVVQLRLAPLTSKLNRSVCADHNLELEGWLLIDRQHVHEEQALCGLQGGFIFRIYDRSRPAGVCESYRGETRLESECVKGEGMIFNFRHTRCVPELLKMSSLQSVACVINWREGPYSFILLRHNALPSFWLLRYLTTSGDSFTAYLFLDLFANIGDPSESGARSLRIDVVRDTPQPATSLCLDDIDFCTRPSVCALWSSQDPLFCPRTCSICDATRPALCHFEESLIGQWYSGAMTSNLLLTVNGSILSTHEKVRENFYCISWQPTIKQHQSVSRIRQSPISTYLMVSDYQNGCRPRYSCLFVVRNHNSSAMFVKISQTRTWPFTANPDVPLDCRSFSYEADQALYPNELRSEKVLLLFRSPPVSFSQQAKCNLPTSQMREFVVQFRDGRQCLVEMRAEESDRLQFTMKHSCVTSDFVLESDYLCLESVRLPPNNDLVVVTRAATVMSQLLCWIFPRKLPSTIYLVDAVDCDETVRYRVRQETLQPLAVFARESDTVLEHHDLSSKVTPDSAADQAGMIASQEIADDVSSKDVNLIPDDNFTITMTSVRQEMPAKASVYLIITSVLLFLMSSLTHCFGC